MTKYKRRPPNMAEKLAATLLQLKRYNEDGKLVDVIDREEAKGKAAKEICAMFAFDHFPVPHTWGGSNHPTNLQPLLKGDHIEKTSTFDQPAIAKVRRWEKKQARTQVETDEFRRRLLSTPAPREKPKPTHRRKMSGQVVRIEEEGER